MENCEVDFAEVDCSSFAKFYLKPASLMDLTELYQYARVPEDNRAEHSIDIATQDIENDNFNIAEKKNYDIETACNDQLYSSQATEQSNNYEFYDDTSSASTVTSNSTIAFNDLTTPLTVADNSAIESSSYYQVSLIQVIEQSNNYDFHDGSSPATIIKSNSSILCDSSATPLTDEDNHGDMSHFLSQAAEKSNDNLLTEFTSNMFNYTPLIDFASNNLMVDQNSIIANPPLSKDKCMVKHDGHVRSPVCPRSLDITSPSSIMVVQSPAMSDTNIEVSSKKNRGRPLKRRGVQLVQDPTSLSSTERVADKCVTKKPSSRKRPHKYLSVTTLNSHTHSATEDEQNLPPSKLLRSSKTKIYKTFNALIDMRKDALSMQLEKIENSIREAKDSIDLLNLKKIRVMLKRDINGI